MRSMVSLSVGKEEVVEEMFARTFKMDKTKDQE